MGESSSSVIIDRDKRFINYLSNEEGKLIYIPDIENYTMEIVDGTLILTPKQQFDREERVEEEIKHINFEYSIIRKCIIKCGEEELPTTKLKYASILKVILESMPKEEILQHKEFIPIKDVKEDGDRDSSYKWCKKINMWIRYENANKTLKSILHMVKINAYSIYIHISVKTSEQVSFSPLNIRTKTRRVVIDSVQN